MVERRVNLTRHGVLLRRQPPVRVVYCQAPAFSLVVCSLCLGPPSATCALCRFAYCASCLERHQERRSVPPQAWQGVARQLRAQLLKATGLPVTHRFRLDYRRPMFFLEVEGRRVHDAPPVRIAFCRVPATCNIEASCGHRAKTCTAGQTECPDCRFPYCDRHYPTHRYQTVAARPVWQPVIEQLERQLEACVLARGKSLIRLRVPPLPRKPSPAG
jgi:hypothetical protein